MKTTSELENEFKGLPVVNQEASNYKISIATGPDGTVNNIIEISKEGVHFVVMRGAREWMIQRLGATNYIYPIVERWLTRKISQLKNDPNSLHSIGLALEHNQPAVCDGLIMDLLGDKYRDLINHPSTRKALFEKVSDFLQACTDYQCRPRIVYTGSQYKVVC